LRSFVKYLSGSVHKMHIPKEFKTNAIEITKREGLRLDSFDIKSGYLGFKDGVYSFKENRLLKSEESESLHISNTLMVDYYYNKLGKIKPEFVDYIEKIIPLKSMRDYFGTMLNKGLQGIVLRTVLIHSNILGSNSKTTFFELLRNTFPNKTIACNNALLYSNSNDSSGGHTEHLMGLNGKAFAYFSEPDEGKAMNSAFLRKISGGDTITGSEKHKHNESFKSKALQNILCNGIASLDSTAKAAQDRVWVFPWLARFTHNKSLVNPAKYIYLIDETITDKLEQWYESMVIWILSYTRKDIVIPDEVQKATEALRKRENHIKQFIEHRIIKGSKLFDYIKPKDIYAQYKLWCSSRGMTPLKPMNNFIETFKFDVDEDSYTEDNKNFGIDRIRIKNCFIGYKLKGDDVEDDNIDLLDPPKTNSVPPKRNTVPPAYLFKNVS
jgi:hypothetical protein